MRKHADRHFCKRWRKRIDADIGRWHPMAQESLKVVEQAMPKTIVWLGGPSRESPHRWVRDTLAEVLEQYGFRVKYSENLRGSKTIASKELREVTSPGTIPIILMLSPGAAAEAIEFSHFKVRGSRMTIFVPREFKGGYVFRSLVQTHKTAHAGSLFSLSELRTCQKCDLAIRAHEAAINLRDYLFRERGTQ